MTVYNPDSIPEVDPVRVGLVGVAQTTFSDDKFEVFKGSVKGMRDLSDEMGFELYFYNELIQGIEGAIRARNMMEEVDIDLLIVQNSSFSSGDFVPLFAEVDAELALWGLPETKDSGSLPLNSFCGTNMYMNILRELENEARFTRRWLYGRTSSDLFQRQLQVSLTAIRAKKNLKGARIGLIIGPAPGFHGLDFSGRELRKRFGVEIVRFSDYSEIIEVAESFDNGEANEVANRLKSNATAEECSGDTFEKSVRFYMALREVAEKYGINSFAMRCWPELQDSYGIFPCSANSQLTEDGIMTSCEGDVLGAVSMLVLYYMEKTPSVVMDLSNVDFNDDTALFWHCGNAPTSFAYQGNYREEDHFNHPGMGCVRDMVLKPQKSTCIRFSGDSSTCFLLEGEFIKPEKESFDGSRGWFGNFSINGKDANLKELLGTIMDHGLEHHYTFIPGHIRPSLLELFNMLDVGVLDKSDSVV